MSKGLCKRYNQTIDAKEEIRRNVEFIKEKGSRGFCLLKTRIIFLIGRIRYEREDTRTY